MIAITNYSEFVDNELSKNNLKIVAVTEDFLIKRLVDIKNFVNGVRKEFSNKYGWKDENDEYFLKPMDRKFSYSYIIVNEKNEIVNLNFNSIYGDEMHIHCMYTKNDFRKKGLSKLAVIKLAQRGIDDGFKAIDGYWPKKNNGSLILFLKLGWEIENIRNGFEVNLKGNLNEIINNAFRLYCKENLQNN